MGKRSRPRAAQRPVRDDSAPTAQQLESTKHELQVVQHELTVYREETRMQTEELVESRRALEQSRDRYADLYDFAPIGYATLDAMGCIQEINLTGAALFAEERSRLIASPLLLRVVPGDRRKLLDHLRRCRLSKTTVMTELSIDSGGTPLPVQVSSKLVPTSDGSRALRTVIVDQRDKRRAEAELEITNQQLETRSRELEQQTRTLRRLRRQLVEAQDAERRRIAALLHDDVQQALYAIRLKVSLLGGGEKTRELESIVDRTIDSCRALSSELRPPILHDLGLGPSLKWLAGRMREAHGLHTTVKAPAHLELPQPATVALYNAVRELLFNVVKHANTGHALVEVVVTDGLSVEVHDTGRGFLSATPSESAPHMGLANIAENLEMLGGSFSIDSAPGSGTRARLVLPIEALVTRQRGRQESSRPTVERGRQTGRRPKPPRAPKKDT